MARVNIPRKASRYRRGGLSMSSPVRLHSPKDHAPVHRENSPSQKKAVPELPKRRKIRETRAMIIPSTRRNTEKSRENPISENSLAVIWAGLPSRTGWSVATSRWEGERYSSVSVTSGPVSGRGTSAVFVGGSSRNAGKSPSCPYSNIRCPSA